ncbi:MAG: homoserine dehydrogenase [Oscillospiraceae bacterium]|nr:homoserine dehydrogenase [Oscillospiraceae bacterium]
MIKVPVLGYGIVGSGVVSLLNKNAKHISKNAGQDIQVKYILDIKEFPNDPFEKLFVNDFETIIHDPEVTIVVEAIGGIGIAYDYTQRCLQAGKHVITSNKELVAEHGGELMRHAQERDVNFLFEASVGGGIPVIRPLVQCMTANIIGEIYGILNGTTNYILTNMEQNGTSFSDALLEAQQKGYAEADPTADIEGFDTCRKICILSSLAFGQHISPNQVPTEGIKNVKTSDMHYASTLGYEIKLLGRARAINDKAAVYVAPHLVNKDNLLSIVNYAMNGVVVRGNAVGDVVLCGAGAGKLPTASAVVADIIDAVKHLHTRRWIGWAQDNVNITIDPNQLESAWYIKTDASKEKVEHEFGTVLFAENKNKTPTTSVGKEYNETAFITSVMSGNKVDELLSRSIKALSRFRVLGDH